MFKKNIERTPQQKAQRAKMSILARLGGCAYLIYIMYQLIVPQPGTHPTQTMTIIAIVMIVLAVGVISFTIYDLVRSLKSGLLNASAYEEYGADTADKDTYESPYKNLNILNTSFPSSQEADPDVTEPEVDENDETDNEDGSDASDE